MGNARRAAPDDEVVEASAAPRARRAAAGRRGFRVGLAALAVTIAGVMTAGLVLLPAESDQRSDPDRAVPASLRNSRSLPRPALPSVSPEVSASPAGLPTSPPKPATDTTKSASAKATQAKPKEPKPDYADLAKTAGTRYAEASVNVRRGPGVSFGVTDTLSRGESVKITSRLVAGWRQVNSGGDAGWIKATLLTAEKPKPVSTASAASSGGFSTAVCAKARALEGHLTAKTDRVLRAVCAKFPSVSSYGGYRAGDPGYHGSGQAIDIMISGQAGWEIARWARANAAALGVIEVIYQQQIWTTQRSGDGWRPMSDRGSVSANHYDHVHLSVGG